MSVRVVRLSMLLSYVTWTCIFFFFSSRRRHTRCGRDWSSDVCSSDLRRRHRQRPAVSNRDRRRDGGTLTVSSPTADPSMPGTIVAAPRHRPLDGTAQPVTVIVPFMPEPTWNVQMNVYVPGDRLIVAVPDWPGGFTTLIPLPWIVKVCVAAESTFEIVTRSPSWTVTVDGVKTSFPPRSCST